MIIDKRTTLADNVALNTGAAGTYNIGDVYDTQMVAGDPGTGGDIYIVIALGTAAASGGAATGTFQLVSSASATPETNGAQQILMATGAVPVASMGANVQLYAGVLPNGVTRRYLGLQQVTGTAAFTAGTVKCFMTLDVASYRAYIAGTTT